MRSLPLDYAVRNLGRRPGRTVLNGIACALVAAVLAATVAFVRGLDQSLASQGRDDVAVLVSSSSMRDILRSAVSESVADLVAAAVPGVLEVHGVAAVSREIHLGTRIEVGAASSELPGGLPGLVRGVTDRAYLVHETVTLIEGATPGPSEVIVGRLAAARLGVPAEAMAVGATLRFEGATHTIAGVFAAPGTTLESEVWAPLHPLQGLARRADVSVVFVRTHSPDDIADVAAFAQRRLDLELICIPSAAYYREAAAYFDPIRALAGLMALLIAVSVIVTGANTFHAVAIERVGELAALRAVGYSAFALIRSLSAEALVLAAAGGVLGILGCLVIVDDVAFRIGMTAFALEVNGECVVAAFAGVLLLAALGTVPAALETARLEIAVALKPD